MFSLVEMEKQINEFGINVDNYCFLCFLFGNDFMPHFPSLNIRNDGIPYLLEVYKKLNVNLVTTSINWNSFRLLCLELMKNEEERVKMNVEWKKKLKVHPLTAEDELNVLPVRDRAREEYIGNHFSQYNTFLFGQEDKNPCTNYLQMLEWTWFYYNGTCKDYYMMYEFSHAPLFKSLVKYIPCFDEELVATNLEPPPLAIAQLMYVLPYQNYELVPINTIPIVKQFPNLSETFFPIHYEFCKFFWESHVSFNYINVSELNKYIKSNM